MVISNSENAHRRRTIPANTDLSDSLMPQKRARARGEALLDLKPSTPGFVDPGTVRVPAQGYEFFS
jgi:hypothetical protein